MEISAIMSSQSSKLAVSAGRSAVRAQLGARDVSATNHVPPFSRLLADSASIFPWTDPARADLRSCSGFRRIIRRSARSATLLRGARLQPSNLIADKIVAARIRLLSHIKYSPRYSGTADRVEKSWRIGVHARGRVIFLSTGRSGLINRARDYRETRANRANRGRQFPGPRHRYVISRAARNSFYGLSGVKHYVPLLRSEIFIGMCPPGIGSLASLLRAVNRRASRFINFL